MNILTQEDSKGHMVQAVWGLMCQGEDYPVFRARIVDMELIQITRYWGSNLVPQINDNPRMFLSRMFSKLKYLSMKIM